MCLFHCVGVCPAGHPARWALDANQALGNKTWQLYSVMPCTHCLKKNLISLKNVLDDAEKLFNPLVHVFIIFCKVKWERAQNISAVH